jgi:hypothetical protein
MESVSRASWTDGRLEDLARNTDRRFDEVEHRFDEIDRRFDGVDRRIDGLERRMGARFDSIDTRLHALQRTMVQTTVGMSAVVVTALIAVAG